MKTMAMAAAGVALVLATGGVAFGQVCDQAFADTFASADLNGRARAMVVFNGTLIAAGDFSYAGGLPATRVARWDGSRWTKLGNGFNSTVTTLTVFNGQLLAGGFFSASGTTNLRGVARWNGTAWEQFGQALNSTVNSMVVYNNQLYVTGDFTQPVSGSPVLNRFARWNGTAWEAVGTGLAGGGGNALWEHAGQLYVAGDFTSANGVANTVRVARLAGTTFAAVGSGFANGTVNVMTTHNGSLYAGGTFTLSGATSLNRVARFNGTNWVDVGAGVNSTVYSLLSYNDGSGPALFVGGSFGIAGVDPLFYAAKFTGSEWLPVSAPNSTVWSMLPYDDGSGTKLFLSGDFSALGTENGQSILAGQFGVWNGTQSGDAGRGVNGPVKAFAFYDNKLWVGGGFNRAGRTAVTNLASFDGGAFARPGTFAFNGDINSMVTLGDQLWIGGEFFRTGNPATGFARVARWDGSQFIAAGNGLNSTVNVLHVHNNEVVAGGFFGADGAGTTSLGRTARFTGGAWAQIGDGLNSTVNDFVTYNGQLYATGGFTNNFNSNAAQPPLRIARWNQNTNVWERVAQGLSAQGNCLAVYNNELYVGGQFNTAGLTSANRIARWNPTDGWQDVGGGTTTGNVTDMFTYNDGAGEALYVIGTFSDMGGVSANRIAKWNGTTWCSVGTGVDPQLGHQLNTIFAFQGLGGRNLVVGMNNGDALAGSSGNNIARIVGCPADIDDGSGTGSPDGGVTIEDLLYYLVVFGNGVIAADVDNGSGTGTPDGGVTIEDLLYYLVRFENGC